MIKRHQGYIWGAKFRILFDHKALKISETFKTTTRESSGGSSVSPRSTTSLSPERAAPTAMPIFSPVCHSRQLSTTAVVLAASLL